MLVAVFLAIYIFVYFSGGLLARKVIGSVDNDKSNALLNMAESAYRDGYLENSAQYYEEYINSTQSKTKKINGYKKLFEISVLRKRNEDALISLKEIELLDRNNPFTYLSRIKLLMRMGEFKGVKFEIDRNHNKLRKSPEFAVLLSIYLMNESRFQEALNELSKISFNKRDFNTHKQIIICNIKLNRITNALSYSEKIEPLLRVLDNKADIGELELLRAIARLYRGDQEILTEKLRPDFFTTKLKRISFNIIAYNYMDKDRYEELNEFLSTDFKIKQDNSSLYEAIGKYYYYRKDYQNAAVYYEKIPSIRPYFNKDYLALSDIYYRYGDYKSSIEMMNNANSMFQYKSPAYFKNMSTVKLRLSGFAESAYYLKSGLDEYPDDMDFYIRLIKLHIDNGFNDTATDYLKMAMKKSEKLGLTEYNSKFDKLKLMLLNESSESSEMELLNIRNRLESGIDGYFKIITFYLKDNKFINAKREIDSALNTPLNKDEKALINTLDFIYAVNSGDKTEYNSKRNIFLADENFSFYNKSIIHFIDGDYERTIETLEKYKTTLKTNNNDEYEPEEIGKYEYLSALSHYFDGNLPEANKSLNRYLDIKKYDRKALYLKNLINTTLEKNKNK